MGKERLWRTKMPGCWAPGATDLLLNCIFPYPLKHLAPSLSRNETAKRNAHRHTKGLVSAIVLLGSSSTSLEPRSLFHSVSSEGRKMGEGLYTQNHAEPSHPFSLADPAALNSAAPIPLGAATLCSPPRLRQGREVWTLSPLGSGWRQGLLDRWPTRTLLEL